MSKTNTWEGSSGVLKLAYAALCHLPLVIVSAVARAAAWLLLAAHVQAKVAQLVVRLISVLVVNTLPAFKWSAKVLRNNPAVFHKAVCLGARQHAAIQRHVVVQNAIPTDFHISVGFNSASACAAALCRALQACARQLRAAASAFPCVVGALQLLAQGCRWAPADGITNRASYGSAISLPPVHLNNLSSRANRRVFRDRFHVDRPCHLSEGVIVNV